jgi:hypothetical protein
MSKIRRLMLNRSKFKRQSSSCSNAVFLTRLVINDVFIIHTLTISINLIAVNTMIFDEGEMGLHADELHKRALNLCRTISQSPSLDITT